jgi:hypothetical protein
MAVLLTETGDVTVEATDGLWVAAADAERATGWRLKPEGMCRDALCVPLPAGALRAGAVDLASFWRRLDNVVLSDDAGEVWVLGAGAGARNQALAALAAPDFALPDLDGTPHRLSELRGRKVFLASWASW